MTGKSCGLRGSPTTHKSRADAALREMDGALRDVDHYALVVHQCWPALRALQNAADHSGRAFTHVRWFQSGASARRKRLKVLNGRLAIAEKTFRKHCMIPGYMK